MNRTRVTQAILVGILLFHGFCQTSNGQILSGYVYEGSINDTSQPIEGTSVRLYGSNNSASLGNEIDHTTTNANGWYGLDASKVYELYTIIEEDQQGYVSVDATSVGGQVINANTIKYTYPLSQKVLSQNLFWDKKDQPSNSPPIADAGGPYNGYVGQWIKFDGSQSYDPDQGDQISRWEWDMDQDGTFDLEGQTVYWKWDKQTSGTVKLRVMDTHQATDTATATYIVESEPVLTGKILGICFNDINSNGEQDQDEQGLEGWTIYLDDNNNGELDKGEVFMHTLNDGSFMFDDLEPGVYLVREVLQDGWDQIHPLEKYYEINLPPNQTISGLSFSNLQRAEYDFGDASDPSYPTLLANDGARHWIHPGLCLGERVDGDDNGQPDFLAIGDDIDIEGDDEDGVRFWMDLVPGDWASVHIDVSNSTTEDQEVVVAGWIDFDQNDVWDWDELAVHLDPVVVPPGEGAVWRPAFEIPSDAALGQTYARFRLYKVERNEFGDIISPGLLPFGYGGAGEVEDYTIVIGDVIYAEDLNADPCWPTEGGWAFGEPLGAGGAFGYPDPNAGFTGSNVYGVNLAGDYDITAGGPYILTAGPFDCSGYRKVMLRFARWLNSDNPPFIRNTVEVSYMVDTETWWGRIRIDEVIWESSTWDITANQWQVVEYDISDLAGCDSYVYIKWGYEVLEGAFPYSGWNIDDIELLGVPNRTVHFEDPNLKAIVEAELGVLDPTVCDMLSLESLGGPGWWWGWWGFDHIYDLTGLEFAENLDTLVLYNGAVSDLSPIENLSELRVLVVENHEISDLSPLEGLANLTYLGMSSNQIDDISPLESLSNLIGLYLANNEIHDISPLESLSSLTELYLDRNEIHNLSPLEDLINLDMLDLSYNGIDNISSLENLSNLTVLHLAGNEIRDISPLEDLDNLYFLDMSYNQIDDIGPLESKRSLTRIRLHNNEIRDISPLVWDTWWLTELWLTNNPLDEDSCNFYISMIERRNPGIDLDHSCW